jgi:hypothetical protein
VLVSEAEQDRRDDHCVPGRARDTLLDHGVDVRVGAYRWFVPTLEEITYEAGRDALADQESIVSGVRQRTGTQLAAHALVGVPMGAQAPAWIAALAIR